MANDFIHLPAPAANGAGAWTDCSGLGGLRTIVVTTPDSFVTIECSNQVSPTSAYSATAFQANGETTVQIAAHWMRAVVSNFAAGGVAPVVNVGSTDDGTTTDQLATTAGTGVAAATDTSALPAFKTIQVTGGFKGSLNVEISEDGGTTYATTYSFANGGSQSGMFVADFMRVRRINVAPGGAMPQVWVGATAPPGGGGGGGGGGAPQMTISRFSPADGDEVLLVSNAVNVIDAQHIINGITLQMPLAASSPAGTPLEISVVNLGAAPLNAPYVGLAARLGASAFAVLGMDVSGSDTIDEQPGFAVGSFVKNGDSARLVSDGISDWSVTAATWVNVGIASAPVTSGGGNQQLDFSAGSTPTGYVPNLILVANQTGNTLVINAMSAGYLGQRVVIYAADPLHTFKLHANFGGALTNNCKAFRGTATDYTLAVGSSRMLEYGYDGGDSSIGCWYILGDA